jgi:hypothetical protein
LAAAEIVLQAPADADLRDGAPVFFGQLLHLRHFEDVADTERLYASSWM